MSAQTESLHDMHTLLQELSDLKAVHTPEHCQGWFGEAKNKAERVYAAYKDVDSKASVLQKQYAAMTWDQFRDAMLRSKEDADDIFKIMINDGAGKTFLTAHFPTVAAVRPA